MCSRAHVSRSSTKLMSFLRWGALCSRPNAVVNISRFPNTRLLCSLRVASKGKIFDLNSYRTYASKSQPKSTASLVPGSQQPLTSESARQEYGRAEEKMQIAVEWFRKECAGYEARASGRVTTALLDSVRIQLSGRNDGSMGLNEVATVGVRDGSTLLITVFDEQYTVKHVEHALYDANLPNIVPQRQDDRTIKIPIPKPTVEARTALYTSAHRQAEDTRVQVRKIHQASVKRGKFGKHSVELEQFQKLTDRFVGEVDKILTQLKKSTGTR